MRIEERKAEDRTVGDRFQTVEWPLRERLPFSSAGRGAYQLPSLVDGITATL